MKKIITVVGARPQFIKLAPISVLIKKYFKEVIVHTGQHYDYELSEIFFKELGIDKPHINLNIGSASHGSMTGKMIIELEKVFLAEKPDLVTIFGDTNSTLAASIAAVKLKIPIAHIEAGLRNFNINIPEEVNRIVSDKLSTLLFAPTQTAVNNLANEGIRKGVFLTGDVMYDSVMHFKEKARINSKVLKDYKLKKKNYIFATIHRQENTDDIKKLKDIIGAFNEAKQLIFFPIHPRTKEQIKKNKITINKNFVISANPVGYLDSLNLIMNAKKVITDSGGIQKESYILKTPCITVFENTSWPETVADGLNILVKTKKNEILSIISSFDAKNSKYCLHYGDGSASNKIVNIIKQYLKE